ncbi:uncharacterized protein LOC144690995 [Cetorhinus maximus]
MLGTLMTVLFLVVRAVGKFGAELFQEEPPRYRVYQPLPWHLQNVSRPRKSSRVGEKGGSQRRSIIPSKGITGEGTPHPLSEEKGSFTEPNSDRAAVTIQTQYRRYRQRKHDERDP